MLNAAVEIKSGLNDGVLGEALLKKRIARPGTGKSGGFRVIVAFSKGRDRLLFFYGFAKTEKSNISLTERAALGELATRFVSMTETELEIASDQHIFREVMGDSNE